MLLHGAVGIAAGLHLRMRHTAFSLLLQGLFPPGWIFCWRLLPIFPLRKSFPKHFRAGSFRLLPSFSALPFFLFLFFLFSLPNFYYLWKRSDYFSVTRRNFAGFALLQLLLAVSYAFSYAVGAFLVLTLITAYIA